MNVGRKREREKKREKKREKEKEKEVQAKATGAKGKSNKNGNCFFSSFLCSILCKYERMKWCIRNCESGKRKEEVETAKGVD